MAKTQKQKRQAKRIQRTKRKTDVKTRRETQRTTPKVAPKPRIKRTQAVKVRRKIRQTREDIAREIQRLATIARKEAIEMQKRLDIAVETAKNFKEAQEAKRPTQIFKSPRIAAKRQEKAMHKGPRFSIATGADRDIIDALEVVRNANRRIPVPGFLRVSNLPTTLQDPAAADLIVTHLNQVIMLIIQQGLTNTKERGFHGVEIMIHGQNTNVSDYDPSNGKRIAGPISIGSLSELEDMSLMQALYDQAAKSFDNYYREDGSVENAEFIELTGFSIMSGLPKGERLNHPKLYAFSNVLDQTFIADQLMACSNANICIYETFYTIIILSHQERHDWKRWSRVKRSEICVQKLTEESDEIQAAVNSGSLEQSMLLLCDKYKVSFPVWMHDSPRVRIYKPKQKIVELSHYEYMMMVTTKEERIAFNSYHTTTKAQKRDFCDEMEEFESGGLYTYESQHISTHSPGKMFIKMMCEDKNPEQWKKNYSGFKIQGPKNAPKPASDAKFIIGAWDIETIVHQDEDGVARNKPFMVDMRLADRDEHITFWGLDCMDVFAQWIVDNLIDTTKMSKSHKKSTAPVYRLYAHNGAKFDNLFLYYAFRNIHWPIKATKAGTSLVYMKALNVDFVDSNLILVNSLRKLGKMFNVKSGGKTVFPYSFPTTEMVEEGYVGDVPAEEYWNGDERQEFIDAQDKSWSGTWDFKKIAVDYCARDVDVLFEVMTKFLKTCSGTATIGDRENVPFDTRSGITAAGMALTSFKQLALTAPSTEINIRTGEVIDLDRTIYISGTLDVQEAAQEAYYGGLTGNAKQHMISDPIDEAHTLSMCSQPIRYGGRYTNHRRLLKYMDANSMYPAMMLKAFPIVLKGTKINHHSSWRKTKKFIDHYLYRVRVVYPLDSYDNPIIPNIVRRNEVGSLRNPLDQWTEDGLWHWGCELNLAQDKYEADITYDAYINYGCDYVFRDMMRHLYSKRQIVKGLMRKCQDPMEMSILEAESNRLKLTMNSLYGKFGQKKFNESKLLSHTEFMDLSFNPNIVIKEIEEITDLDQWFVVYEDKTKNRKRSIGNMIHWASYTTALARTNLCEFMHLVGFENVVYHDTDSTIFLSSPKIEARIAPLCSQTELGMWSNELSNDNYIPY